MMLFRMLSFWTPRELSFCLEATLKVILFDLCIDPWAAFPRDLWKGLLSWEIEFWEIESSSDFSLLLVLVLWRSCNFHFFLDASCPFRGKRKVSELIRLFSSKSYGISGSMWESTFLVERGGISLSSKFSFSGSNSCEVLSSFRSSITNDEDYALPCRFPALSFWIGCWSWFTPVTNKLFLYEVMEDSIE